MAEILQNLDRQENREIPKPVKILIIDYNNSVINNLETDLQNTFSNNPNIIIEQCPNTNVAILTIKKHNPNILFFDFRRTCCNGKEEEKILQHIEEKGIKAFSTMGNIIKEINCIEKGIERINKNEILNKIKSILSPQKEDEI
ncbi:MAG: hypothetical protein ABH808_00085 [Candidatus Kuenenbacteria bacterium]